MTIDRDPWWGLLVRGPLEEGRSILKRVGIAHSAHAFVPGSGWYGFFSFRYEPIQWELADALRDAGREVIALHYDRDGVGFAHYWRDGRWDEEQAGLHDLALERGITPPEKQLRGRPRREAALVEGASLEDVLAAIAGADVRATSRGAIVLGPAAARLDYEDHPQVTVTQLTHYLDNDEFSCSIQRGGSVQIYDVPRDPDFGLRRLDAVAGETDPRAITRALGIPEDYLFP